jgi:hypothetical protein
MLGAGPASTPLLASAPQGVDAVANHRVKPGGDGPHDMTMTILIGQSIPPLV